MTATTTASQELSLQLAPNICFYGRAIEALDFYAAVLGGTYNALRFSEGPDNCNVPPDRVNDVMHAEFDAPGIRFMANDGMDRDVRTGGPIALTLSGTDVEKGKRIFEALSEGGTIISPLEPQFWGALFGLVTDRFGIEWMINVGTGPKQ
ncbi:MAG: VOC family protein [Candidatus Eremiobacteraeota bacterium]|nr:VOC family protein [Candidatus Eremiobacteraeota bacterium]